MKKSFAAVLLLALAFAVLWPLFKSDTPVADRVAVNDAVVTALQENDLAEATELLTERLTREAERLDADREGRERRVLFILCVYIGVLLLACGWLFIYCERSVLRPFRKLERFASRVAQGDLDFPLEMDRQNRFGAFSESFDLMREQLAAARENERLADISKKELVASLSHDVKTPVSSIKAIAELYQARHGETEEMSAIIAKADQIDLLISNMFSATLEELKQLKVSPEEIASAEVGEIIRASDYERKVRPFSLPECVVTADRLRLRQVIDNILGNAYKYAGTDIEVSARFEGKTLALCLRDFGSGVPAEELPLISGKFFRGGNAEGKNGSGLGLYLAEYFVSQMGGELTLESNGGLFVTIRLKI